MQGSHTSTSACHNDGDNRRLQLVSTAEQGLPEPLAGTVDGHLATFAAHVREGLLAASTAVGLEVMAQMMQAEVTDLAGVKGCHNPDRSHTRHGTERGAVTLGGRRLAVSRPRVRTVGDQAVEAPLSTYQTLADADLLTEQVTAKMLAGISTRTYPVALEPVGEAVERSATSTSKSAVSRRFVTATAERLAELCARPLGEHRWPIVMLDGVHLGEHLLVVALGVTDDGIKVPLGVAEGSTENAEVCARLVADLVDRGLDATAGVLFVIDGGKALAKAIRAAFGPKALIQRCRRHKERNVTGHLPETERPLIQRKLRAAWANPDPDAARRDLDALARALDKKRPGAAASLREGLEHTLTVNRLSVTGSLLKTVESTNPVESMIEIVRHHARRVKRWQHGEMALRWTAAGMLAAEDQFRRVKGFRQLPSLLTALAEATADQPGADIAPDVSAPVTA
jgi:transposase-like protein